MRTPSHVLIAAAVWLGYRLLKTSSLDFPRLDAVLLTIVAGSLVTTIPYNTAINLTPLRLVRFRRP